MVFDFCKELLMSPIHGTRKMLRMSKYPSIIAK